jgi:hypothetical protein
MKALVKRVIYRVLDRPDGADNPIEIEVDLEGICRFGARWWADYARGGPRMKDVGPGYHATWASALMLMNDMKIPQASADALDRFEADLASSTADRLSHLLAPSPGSPKDWIPHMTLSTDYGPEGILRDCCAMHKVWSIPGKTMMTAGLFEVSVHGYAGSNEQWLWFPVDADGHRIYATQGTEEGSPAVRHEVRVREEERRFPGEAEGDPEVIEKIQVEYDVYVVDAVHKDTVLAQIAEKRARLEAKLPEIAVRRAELKKKRDERHDEMTQEEYRFLERHYETEQPFFWHDQARKRIEEEPDHADAIKPKEESKPTPRSRPRSTFDLDDGFAVTKPTRLFGEGDEIFGRRTPKG